MGPILLIDDEPRMREMIRGMLESEKFEVIEAPNGFVGLAQYRRHKPALIITDILMPEKDGIETLREIRKLDPDAKVIAMSGGGRAKYIDFLAIAQEFGATEILEKPFRREQMLAAVGRALRGAAPG